jgi:prepilin-type processing-associated H-X9-DG protein
MRQLGVGFNLFVDEHDDRYPPAGYGTGVGQLSWDSWINRYIGGTASDADLITGLTPTAVCPRIEKCPADRIPTLESDPQWGWVTWGMRRTYAMNSVGPNWMSDYQIPTANQRYPLPDLNVTGRHGVGIYWMDNGLPATGLPDWEAKGYKTSVVGDPAGTILLVEEPNIQNVAGNIWPCICNGPRGAGDLYQVDPAPDAKNFGNDAYGIHSKRFNYLFHDNHVQSLKIEQTVGTGNLDNPKGMWTVRKGD